ncbi:MAG: putative metalloprotease CJM1_0395 family protein [Planctomycetota bacterium]
MSSIGSISSSVNSLLAFGAGVRRPLGVAMAPTSGRGAERPVFENVEPAGGAGRANAGASEGPLTATAYQRNADGDSVTLGSREDDLTPEEERQVAELKARDQEVRAHEQAHLAAAGPLARGGPRYSYQTGPDGKRYAVGGSVSIDTSPGRTPEETLDKARRIQAAALAPAEPSSTDRAVAAKAAQMAAQAQREAAEQQREDGTNRSDTDAPQGEPKSERRDSTSAPIAALAIDVYA